MAEDVQWFDRSSSEVLGGLLRAANGRLLVVITARDGGWLPDNWPVNVFDLNPLSDEQTDALALELMPALTVEQHVEVRARCDGVPFFYIEQVVAGVGAALSSW